MEKLGDGEGLLGVGDFSVWGAVGGCGGGVDEEELWRNWGGALRLKG